MSALFPPRDLKLYCSTLAGLSVVCGVSVRAEVGPSDGEREEVNVFVQIGAINQAAVAWMAACFQ